MGGNALKEYNVVRLEATEYHYLSNEILNNLKYCLPDTRFDIIPAYKNKQTFGDMDILYSNENNNINVIETIKEHFNPFGIIRNGSCCSITYPSSNGLFQVDFIKSTPEEHDFSLKYYAFNDLGNLVGRIYHKMGLKFGHDGLKYILRNPNKDNQIIKELLITRDWEYVIKLGKFPDYNSYHFNELEDVFNYVIQSPYFNKDIFLLENRNHISRTRDRKRTSYMLFLKWIESHPSLPNFNWRNGKESYLNNCLEDFPEFKKEYYASLERYHYIQKLKEKYNGDLIREWTNLDGKELGTFIKYLNLIIREPYIEKNSIEDISILVKKLYVDYLTRSI